MLVGHNSFALVSASVKKTRRKSRSIYFSSRKALARSRMIRAKKTLYKTAHASGGDPRRNLRFEEGVEEMPVLKIQIW